MQLIKKWLILTLILVIPISGQVKKKKSKSQRLISLIEKEKKVLIDNTEKTYETFNLNVMNSKKNLINKILELKNENKKIIAKSCPARAVVLLNYCGLNDSHVEYIAEQPTSLKLDYYVPGTHLRIISDDILIDDKPDYVLLLAWHLKNPIMDKWKKKGLNSKFIVPNFLEIGIKLQIVRLSNCRQR